MKRRLAQGAVILTLIFFMCAKDKGTAPGKTGAFDARSYLSDRARVTEEFAVSLEQAGDAGEAAAAMSAYSGEMRKLGEMKKNAPPEFTSLDLRTPGKAPADLRDLVEKNVAARMRAMNAYKSALLRYHLNPRVRKAQEEMNAVKDE